MTSTSDGAIDFFLLEIALTGNKGLTASAFLSKAQEFFKDDLIDARVPEALDEDLFFSLVPPKQGIVLDSGYLSSLWSSVRDNADIFEEAREANEEADPLAHPNQKAFLETHRQTRLLASNDRIWHAITGHGPDLRRVPNSEFQCLVVIAAAGPTGILQPDVVQATQQDKRSVPKRTDRLASNGYITKESVLGGGSRTSLLRLKRYANQAPTGELRIASNTARIRDGDVASIVRYDEWFDVIVRTLSESDGVCTTEHLRQTIGIKPGKGYHHLTRSLMRCLRRLEGKGLMQRLRARVQPDHPLSKKAPTSRGEPHQWIKCIKLKRQPEDGDRDIFKADLKRGSMWMASGKSADGNDHDESDQDDDVFEEVSTDALQNDRTLRRSVPTAWSPDVHFSNLMFNAAEAAGKEGIQTIGLAEAFGSPGYRRAFDDAMARVSDLWYASQPPHLRHLSIIRDTLLDRSSSNYLFRTYSSYQKAVEAGEASWDYIIDTPEVAEAVRQLPDLDEWGFIKIPASELCSANLAFTACANTTPLRGKQLQPIGGTHKRMPKTPTKLQDDTTARSDAVLDVVNPRSGSSVTTKTLANSQQVEPIVAAAPSPAKSDNAAGRSHTKQMSSPGQNGPLQRQPDFRQEQDLAPSVTTPTPVERKTSLKNEQQRKWTQRYEQLKREWDAASAKRAESLVSRHEVEPDKVAVCTEDLRHMRRPGAYIHEPRAVMINREATTRPGRPKEIFVLVIKSQRLKDLHWYNQDPYAPSQRLKQLVPSLFKDEKQEMPNRESTDRISETPAQTLDPVSHFTAINRPRSVERNSTTVAATKVDEQSISSRSVQNQTVSCPADKKMRLEASSFVQDPTNITDVDASNHPLTPSSSHMHEGPSDHQDYTALDQASAAVTGDSIDDSSKPRPFVSGDRSYHEPVANDAATPNSTTRSAVTRSLATAMSGHDRDTRNEVVLTSISTSTDGKCTAATLAEPSSRVPRSSDHATKTAVTARDARQMITSAEVDLEPIIPPSINNSGESGNMGRKATQSSTRRGGVSRSTGQIEYTRVMIIMDIIRRCDGIFPGIAELFYPFATMWERKQGQKPDHKTLERCVKSLLMAGKLRTVSFSFNYHGGKDKRKISKYLLVDMKLEPSPRDLAVMKRKVEDAYPGCYVPEHLPVKKEFREQLKQRQSINRMGQTAFHLQLAKHFKKDHSVVLDASQLDARLHTAHKRRAERHDARAGRAHLKRTKIMEPSSDSDTSDALESEVEQLMSSFQVRNYQFEPGSAQVDRGSSGRKHVVRRVHFRSHQPTQGPSLGTLEEQRLRRAAQKAIEPVSHESFHFINKTTPDSADHGGQATNFRFETSLPDILQDVPDFDEAGFNAEYNDPESAAFEIEVAKVLEYEKRSIKYGNDHMNAAQRGAFVNHTTPRRFQPAALDRPAYFGATGLVLGESNSSDREGATRDMAAWKSTVPSKAQAAKQTKAKRTLRALPKDPVLRTVRAPDAESPSSVQMLEDFPALRISQQVPRQPASPSAERDEFPEAAAEVHNKEDQRNSIGWKQLLANMKAGSSTWPMNMHEEERLLYSVAVVTTLAGGLQQQGRSTNYQAVNHAMHFKFDATYCRHHWRSMMHRMQGTMERVQHRFRALFLDALERDTLPNVNLADTERIDWPLLVDWTYERLRDDNDSKDGLPNDRHYFQKQYDIQEVAQIDESKDEFAAHSATGTRKDELIHAFSFSQPSLVNELDIRPQIGDVSSLVQSWVRAYCLTPSRYFDREAANGKLYALGQDVAETALNVMLGQKLVRSAQPNRAPVGRRYVLSTSLGQVYALPTHWTVKLFQEAVDYKRALDQLFAMDKDAEDRVCEMTEDISDAQSLAATQLQRAGRAEIEVELPEVNDDLKAPWPKLTKWGFSQTDYRIISGSVACERERFPLSLRPTERYVFDRSNEIMTADEEANRPGAQEELVTRLDCISESVQTARGNRDHAMAGNESERHAENIFPDEQAEANTIAGPSKQPVASTADVRRCEVLEPWLSYPIAAQPVVLSIQHPTDPPGHHRLPYWTDIYGGLMKVHLRQMTILVLYILLGRPGLTAKDMASNCKGRIWTWELTLLCSWLAECGVLAEDKDDLLDDDDDDEEATGESTDPVGSTVGDMLDEDRRWRLAEWWWLAAAVVDGQDGDEGLMGELTVRKRGPRGPWKKKKATTTTTTLPATKRSMF